MSRLQRSSGEQQVYETKLKDGLAVLAIKGDSGTRGRGERELMEKHKREGRGRRRLDENRAISRHVKRKERGIVNPLQKGSRRKRHRRGVGFIMGRGEEGLSVASGVATFAKV